MRRRRPPVPYQRIAELLRKKYNLIIQYPAIFKFVKGARRRKMRAYEGDTRSNKPIVIVKKATPTKLNAHAGPDDDFGFTYSDHYNLTRLSPEEAAARRKKLEEEGH